MATKAADESTGPLDPPNWDLIAATDDPFIYKREVGKTEPHERPDLLAKYIALVAKKDPLTQEQLVHEGKEVWHYLMPSVRKELEKFARQPAERPSKRRGSCAPIRA